MMNLLNLIQTVTGISISLTALAYIAALFLVGPVAVHAFLGPWFKLLGEATAGFLRWVWRVLAVSIPDLVRPWQTLLTLLVLLPLSFGGGYWYAGVDKCPAVSEDIRADYKLIRRTGAEKKAYLKKIGKELPWYDVRKYF